MLYEVNDIICFDVWLMIIELDPKIFSLVRLINRAIRDYTNERMDKYMNLYKQVFNKTMLGFDYFYTHYSLLPNGNRHGKYIEITTCTSIVCNYKNGMLEGEYTERYPFYPFGRIKVISNYKNGVLDDEYKEYNEDGSPKIFRTYTDGVCIKEFNPCKIWEFSKIIYDIANEEDSKSRHVEYCSTLTPESTPEGKKVGISSFILERENVGIVKNLSFSKVKDEKKRYVKHVKYSSMGKHKQRNR